MTVCVDCQKRETIIEFESSFYPNSKLCFFCLVSWIRNMINKFPELKTVIQDIKVLKEVI